MRTEQEIRNKINEIYKLMSKSKINEELNETTND